MKKLRYSISGTFTVSGETEGIRKNELEDILCAELREHLTSFQIDEIEIEEKE